MTDAFVRYLLNLLNYSLTTLVGIIVISKLEVWMKSMQQTTQINYQKKILTACIFDSGVDLLVHMGECHAQRGPLRCHSHPTPPHDPALHVEWLTTTAVSYVRRLIEMVLPKTQKYYDRMSKFMLNFKSRNF